MFFGYHHDQCKANFRCKHCAGPHDSFTCKDKDGVRKHSNCGGNHWATFRGCKRAPYPRTTVKDDENTQQNKNETFRPSSSNFPTLPNTQQQLFSQKAPPPSTQRAPRVTTTQIVKLGSARHADRPIGQDLADIAAQINQLNTAIFSVAELFANMANAFSNINA